MDKEQEKIAESLDAVGEMLANKHLDNRTREALAQLTLQGLKELGYRKLPKGKPPLIDGDYACRLFTNNNFSTRKSVLRVAQAQWDIWNKAIYGGG